MSCHLLKTFTFTLNRLSYRFPTSEQGDEHQHPEPDVTGHTDCRYYLWCGGDTLVVDVPHREVKDSSSYTPPASTPGILPTCSTTVLSAARRS